MRARQRVSLSVLDPKDHSHQQTQRVSHLFCMSKKICNFPTGRNQKVYFGRKGGLLKSVEFTT
jgi:hypothetical protein